MSFNTVNELLDFAISEEEKASEFYVGLADRMDRPWMKKIFVEFSREELGHKAILEGIKKGIIDSRDIVFFLSFTTIVLFLNISIINKLKAK